MGGEPDGLLLIAVAEFGIAVDVDVDDEDVSSIFDVSG
jgi:hypothetical protein